MVFVSTANTFTKPVVEEELEHETDTSKVFNGTFDTDI
jgi:hypothetical protein